MKADKKVDRKKLNCIMKELKKCRSITYYRNAVTKDELDYLEDLGVHHYFGYYKMPHLLIDDYYDVEIVVLELD